MQPFDDAMFRAMDRRFGELKAERQRHESDWREIADFTAPGKSWDEHEDAQGAGGGASSRHRAARFTRLFDTTAVDSSNRFAAALGYLVTNPAQHWFSFGLDDPDLAARPNAHAWLQGERDRVLSVMQSPRINAYTTLDEVYDELGDFGTAPMFLAMNPGGTMRPKALPLAQCWIDENDEGEVDTLYREWSLPAWRVVEMFGGAATSAARLVEQNRADHRVRIRHMVEPRSAAQRRPGSIKRTELAFASVYFEVASKATLRVGGFRYFPFAVPRIGKVSGSVYGRSPAFMHLGAIRTINAVARAGLRVTQTVAEPPMLSPDEGVHNNQMNTQPGGVTYFRRGLGKDNMPRPLNTGGNPQLIEAQRELLEIKIKRAFYNDLLELPMIDRMTATEAAYRQSSSLMVLNPMMLRLESELLSPVVLSVYDAMRRTGAASPVPTELRGRELRPVYVGQLAMSRKAGRVTDVQRWLTGVVAQVAQFDPQAVQAIDTDEILRASARDLGVPARSLRDPEDLAAMRQQAQQQAAEQRAVEQMPMVGQAMRDGAQAAERLGLVQGAGA